MAQKKQAKRSYLVTFLLGIVLFSIVSGIIIYQRLESFFQNSSDSRFSAIITPKSPYQAVEGESTEKFPLVITEPMENTHTKTSFITIRGRTASLAEVFINKKQLRASRIGYFSSRIPLQSGENIFLIAARDSTGNYDEKELRVFYDPPKPTLRPTLKIATVSGILQ